MQLELAVICGCGAVGSQCQPFQAGKLIVGEPQAVANLAKLSKVHHEAACSPMD
jgi:hypothetical protein